MRDFVRTALVAVMFIGSYIVATPATTHAAFSGCSATITANVGAVRCTSSTDFADRYSAKATCRSAPVGGVFKGYAYGLWVASPKTSTARCLPPNVAASVERREVDW